MDCLRFSLYHMVQWGFRLGIDQRDGAMTKSDEYRANAKECQRMADRSASERDKALWLKMMEHWLYLVRQERSSVANAGLQGKN
jgi:hypothetical protein